MSASPTSQLEDQAVGLRKMFEQSLPQVHVFACPSRPNAVLPLVQMLASDLATKGRRVLWVDEIDFPDREAWPLPRQVPFDLQRALDREVDLAQAVVPITSQLWYAFTRRKARDCDANLSQRLAQSGVDFDLVLVSARCKLDDTYAQYKNQVKLLLLSGAKADALSLTMAWAQNLHLSGGIDVSRVVFMGGANSGAGAELWQDVKTQLLPPGQDDDPAISLIPALPAKAKLASLWAKQTLFLEQLQRDFWKD